jgi:hypothetical protein
MKTVNRAGGYIWLPSFAVCPREHMSSQSATFRIECLTTKSFGGVNYGVTKFSFKS